MEQSTQHLLSSTKLLLLSSSLAIALVACGGSDSPSATNPPASDTTAPPASDTTAPTVSSTTPAPDATDVSRSAAITATFDEDMFAITVDDTSFTLAASNNNAAAGSVSFDGANNIASFTASQTLLPITTYTATLGTAITDLSGNPLAAAHSWSFTTADGAWGSAELIETDDASDADDPQIAVDTSGNALAVWRQYDGSQNNIWANRYNAATKSWGTAELIETDNAGSAYNPQIAVDTSGNALAVWRQYDGSRYNIVANRFD